MRQCLRTLGVRTFLQMVKNKNAALSSASMPLFRSRKGLEMDLLMKLLIGIAALIVAIVIVKNLSSGGENIIAQIFEKLKFGT